MHGLIKIHHFDLIVFDEVHYCKAVPDHPYNQIMSEYYFQNSEVKTYSSRPFIIGLANFENIFSEKESKAQIQNRIMSYSNMLNSNLTVLNKS